MSLLSVLKLPPVTAPPAAGNRGERPIAPAAKPSSHPGGANAQGKPAGGQPAAKGAVSAEAKQFTATVLLMLNQVAALDAKKIADAGRLRTAIVTAARAGEKAAGRKEASIALATIGMEIVTLQAKAGIAAANADAAKAAPKDERFDVNVGGKQLKGATNEQVCAELTKVLGTLDADLKRGFEAHCTELQLQQEEPFAAWVSGGIGAIKSKLPGGQQQIDIMDLSIWDDPQQQLRDARAALKRQDVEAVIALLPTIRSGCKAATGKVTRHNADSIDNAQTAVDGLRKVEDVSADVVGGAAEKLWGEEAGIAVKAGYKSVQNAAEQMSAVHIAKTQQEVDWAAVANEGVASAASDIVGLLIKGPMAEKFSGLFGPYLKEAHFDEGELLAMGKAMGIDQAVGRDVLMTKAQRYVKDFLLAKGKGFITSAVSDAIKGKKPDEPPMPIDELIANVAKGAVTDKLLSAFAAFVVSKGTK